MFYFSCHTTNADEIHDGSFQSLCQKVHPHTFLFFPENEPLKLANFIDL